MAKPAPAPSSGSSSSNKAPGSVALPPRRKQVGILGTGHFASAFTQRLLTSGYRVVLGSRDPERHRNLESLVQAWSGKRGKTGDRGDRDASSASAADAASRRRGDDDDDDVVRVTTLQDCVTSNDVIIVALHVEHYEGTFTSSPELSSLCGGKVLVDVSNERLKPASSSAGTAGKTAAAPSFSSNAHLLASLVLPEVFIVKAFNAVPAYVMENDVTAVGGGRRVVKVASDDVTSRAAVCELARELGFEPRDTGDLRKAAGMEERERRLFPQWAVSLAAAAGLVLFWLLFAVSRFYLADNKLEWDQLPLKVMNKVFGAATLSLLALTYFPNTCAGCLQLYRGTRHRRFPGWLDVWLQSRKQLGLMAFALISLHAVISALILSPTYMSAWFAKQALEVNLSANSTRDVVVVNSSRVWMTWVGELSLLVGVVAYGLMALLAVTSLPSVTNTLHWSEWRFLHSGLGGVMLTLAVTHVYVMGVEKWGKTGFPQVLFRVKFLSIVLPTLVLASRLILMLPCVSAHLRSIRLGWERKPPAAHGQQQLTV